MSNPFLRVAVRSWFFVTTREQASKRIEKSLADYLTLAADLDAGMGAKIVQVPAMPGVDPEMQEWSFFMLMEHNAIVNRSISALVEHLVNGSPMAEAGKIDPKTDRLPRNSAGLEQIEQFRKSVEDHLKMSSGLKRLRKTPTKRHPIFGEFDAHQWHCMFGFHLMLHFKQARLIAKGSKEQGSYPD